jgi:predicted phage tail protein|tara:strand:- start:94 stop:291 length:198 start_codon:yes stop_codon:yes gene_type:complete
MKDDKNLNVNINLDAIKNVKKEYKRLKKYMKSNLYQVRTMDGTERTISNLLKNNETVSDDTKLLD